MYKRNNFTEIPTRAEYMQKHTCAVGRASYLLPIPTYIINLWGVCTLSQCLRYCSSLVFTAYTNRYCPPMRAHALGAYGFSLRKKNDPTVFTSSINIFKAVFFIFRRRLKHCAPSACALALPLHLQSIPTNIIHQWGRMHWGRTASACVKQWPNRFLHHP